LAGTGSRNQWKVLFSATREEARAASEQLKAPIVLYDRDQPGRNWQEDMEYLASSAHRPCIILTSTVIDGLLWKEVVRRGGYDVLAKPLREDEVIQVIKLAWSYWISVARTVETSANMAFRK